MCPVINFTHPNCGVYFKRINNFRVATNFTNKSLLATQRTVIDVGAGKFGDIFD